MKIGFDARMIRHSGIGTYTRGILKHLTQKQEFQFTLFGTPSYLEHYPAEKVSADFPIYSVGEQLRFPFLLGKNKLDILHIPHYNAPLGYGRPLVVTIHDLIHLKFPSSRLAYIYARTMLDWVCRKSKKIITDSQNTKRDLIEMVRADEKKITVIPLGVDDHFLKSAGARAQDDKEYILFVGNIKPHKNLKTLMDAFLTAKDKAGEMKLCVVGKNSMPEYTTLYEGRPDIRFISEIDHEELPKIYGKAKFLVLPSFYEGFGLPPLEAMACGVPVVSSNTSSLPEVVGDAAILFNPNDTTELSEIITDLWNNGEKRKTLIAKGFERVKMFSWEKCAEETAKVYLECL